MGLGALGAVSRPVILIYSILMLLYFTWQIISRKNKLFYVLVAGAYVMSIEVFFRMTKAYVFWETGKYAVIWFSLLGMFYLGFKRNAAPYLIFVLLLLPGVLVSYEEMTYDVDFRKSVFFNLSGPLCL